MFVAGSDYPSDLFDVHPVAPAFTVAGEVRLAPFCEVASRSLSQVAIEVPPAAINGQVRILTDEMPFLIVFDERYYVWSESGTRSGTFYYDGESLIINPHLPLLGGQIYLYQLRQGATYDLRLNCVDPPYSEILAQWNIDRYSISRQFNESPTASISFKACRDKENDIRTRFNPRTYSKVILHDIPFRVTQLTITKSGIYTYPNYHLEVQVTLEWALSETFSDSVLNKSISSTTITGVTIGEVNYQVPIRSGTVSIGDKVGSSYNGQVPIALWGGSSINANTVIDALTDGALAIGSFLYKSGEQIITRRWGEVKEHFLSPLDITSDRITYTLSPADGSRRAAPGDEEEEEEELEEEETTPPNPDRGREEIIETTRVEYENAEFEVDLILPYYNDSEAARNPSICFDAGGVTKKKRTITERGGTMLETIEVTYGYAFVSKDVHGFYPDEPRFEYTGLVRDAWIKVQETTTTNYFDEFGYLIKTEIKGNRLARFKQETDQLETSALYIGALIAGLDSEDGQLQLAEIENYKFKFKLPIYDVTDYKLESMMDYYRDIVRPRGDSTWIEPKFCSVATRSQVDRILSESPQQDDDIVRPPIVAVQELLEETRTIITNTKCTPERFKVNQYSNGGEGSGGKNRIVINSSIENLGRPSTHTLVPIQRIYWQDLVKLPTEEEDDKTKEEREEKQQQQIEATSNAIDAARNETLSMTSFYDRDLSEGDKVIFDNRSWIILDMNGEFVCHDNRVTCEEFTMTLGKFEPIAIPIDFNVFGNR
jgi:hypothetical protein